MEVHWCLLGPACEGERLREEWMDSAILCKQMFAQLVLKIRIWLLGPCDLL